jgi:hypothetical protein
MVTSDGIYCFEGLVYLPKALQKQYILNKHDTPLNGHTRPEVVLTRLKKTFYFPHMRQVVFNAIRKYIVCRKAKYERHKLYGLLQLNQAPYGPWATILMDFVGPLLLSQDINSVAYEHIIVVVNRLTKYAIFLPLPTKYNTRYLARTFVNEVVTKHGIPDNIISNRDSLFTSHFWEETY